MTVPEKALERPLENFSELVSPAAAAGPGDLPRGQARFVVAGTAGGCGTTALAALIAAALAARTGLPPRIADHSGGTLLARVATASPAALHTVHDLGPHAAAATAFLASPGVCPVIVASTDPDSADTAWFVLQTLTGAPNGNDADAHAGQPPRGGVIVINSTSRRRPPGPVAARLAQAAPGTAVIPLPWDIALAAPGPVDTARMQPATVAAVAGILQTFGM
ncbi:MAG: hypothetical protein LBI84_00775 [Propionibacteriaceae bacterium]|jgi:hypothetical protein|nr:hypothetical protein [Propionibacteriaceae bacterium]